MKQSYLVPEEFQGERIDKYLSEACCGLTRSYLQKSLKSQLIEVDGITVKSSYRVSAGETVAVEVPAVSYTHLLIFSGIYTRINCIIKDFLYNLNKVQGGDLI